MAGEILDDAPPKLAPSGGTSREIIRKDEDV
jgi:hypothetical protein